MGFQKDTISKNAEPKDGNFYKKKAFLVKKMAKHKNGPERWQQQNVLNLSKCSEYGEEGVAENKLDGDPEAMGKPKYASAAHRVGPGGGFSTRKNGFFPCTPKKITTPFCSKHILPIYFCTL